MEQPVITPHGVLGGRFAASRWFLARARGPAGAGSFLRRDACLTSAAQVALGATAGISWLSRPWLDRHHRWQ